jgi:F-type H+-transporting ATPase subunit epsilon
MPLQLSIITPNSAIDAGAVDSVLLPGAEGEMGILPLHEPLITLLNAGEVIYVQSGKTVNLAIGEGFAEITPTSVNILTDGAIRDLDIDEKAAKDAMEAAQNALRSTTLVGEELEATQASLARSIAMLQVKQRRRSGGSTS